MRPLTELLTAASTTRTHVYGMHRRLTGLAGGYVLVELGLHLSFEFTGRYGGVWWPFILAHQALR